jgi:hypothetical protein
VVVGVVAVLAYNLEWFGGRLHTDWSFALSWGGLPALVGYVAQAPAFRASSAAGAVAVAGASVAVSYAQRRLSTPARLIRRRMQVVSGHAILADGTRCELDRPTLLAPLEQALRTMSVAVPVLAVGLLLGRVGLS